MKKKDKNLASQKPCNFHWRENCKNLASQEPCFLTTSKNKIKRKIYEIDASNRSFGRVASEAAIILRGKHKPEFVPYLDQGDFVKIKNIEKIKITGKKLDQKIYYRHSGYIGNLKQETLRELNKRRPTEFLYRAVYGMLPKNKLTKETIKRLLIE